MFLLRPKPLAIIVAALCHPAFAAGETTLAEVVAVNQRDAQVERKNSALQKIVIAEEEVERYGDATVGDVLRRLPGMSFTGPAGVAKDVRMRGLDKGYTQFLINGEAVAGAKQERQMQVDRLPADMIERIEIIRNPSAEYDAGGIGGTINIVLKNRADNLTRLRAAYGKNGSLDVGDVVAQHAFGNERVDVVLAASHTIGAEDVVEDKKSYNADGTRKGSEQKPKPVKKGETLLAPRLTWKLGEDRLILDPFVSAGYEDKRENNEVRDGAGAVSKRSDASEDKTDRIGRLSGRYEGKTGWGSWYVKAGIQQGREEKDKFSVERNAVNAITKRNQEDEKIEETQRHLGLGLGLPLGNHLLKAGVERRFADYEKEKLVREANNAINPLTPKAAGANDLYEIEETKSIVYLQDEWHFARNHWLTPGLRHERTERDATDRLGNSRQGDQGATNPSLHYRWAATGTLNVRASLAQTLKLPKFDDVNPLLTETTGGALPGSTDNPHKAGNAALEPERATGAELGFEKFFWGGRGVAGLNFYHRKVKDFIQKETYEETGCGFVRCFVERPHNAGEARFWGAELDWRVPLLHKGAHQLTLTGNHAELRGRVRNANGAGNSEVKDMPPRITTLGLDWLHRPSRWSAGFVVNHTPDYRTDSVDGDGKREIKKRNKADLLDLYLQKSFSPAAEVRLIVKNALGIKKDEATAKFKADGSFESSESKVESSEPTIFVTFESRF